MPEAAPRIGVLAPVSSGLADRVRDGGGEPVPLRLPETRPAGGVALAREWISDSLEVSCAGADLDALIFDAGFPEELAGILISALRLGLPAVCANRLEMPFTVALAALGAAPIAADAADIVVDAARDGRPRATDLVENFSLANALRAALSLGGGPESLVHLSAIAREAGVDGFAQMIRVLAPETPAVAACGSGWFREHGPAGLLAYLGGDLHDTRTFAGDLLEELPPAPPDPDTPPGSRLFFVRARASGAEAVCTVYREEAEAAGRCSIFRSEEGAVQALKWDRVDPDAFLVVCGSGPRGGPGLIKLDRLCRAIEEANFSGPVLTDGLAPDMAPGLWVSLFTPEASSGSVLGMLRYGDGLRVDFEKSAIRTSVDPEKFEVREPFSYLEPEGAGYVSRYARSALPALEGAGFD